MSGDSLPIDVTEAILLRLPVKSVGRFKCVSKTWKSLLHDPHFVKKHLHQTTISSPKATNMILRSNNSYYSTNVNQLLPYLNKKDIPATAKEISTPPVMWEYTYGSCNGLVLVEELKGAVFLLNPTTKEVLEIPRNPFALPYKKSIVKYGFGYVPHDDDYKVVSLSCWDPKEDKHYFARECRDMLFVSVYSLRSNSWRKKLHNLPGQAFNHICGSHVLINQNLHWLYKPGCSSPSGLLLTIFTFSLANEEFNEIKLPVSVENERVCLFYNLVDLGGKLGVFLWLRREGKCLCVMEEYGVCESWTKLCSFGYKQSPNRVCLVEESSRDIVLSDQDGVFVYNIYEKRRRNMRIKGGSSGFSVRGTYVESLESPKRIFTTPPLVFKKKQ